MIMRHSVLSMYLSTRNKSAFLNKNELWDLIRALAMIHWITLGKLLQHSLVVFYLSMGRDINHLPWHSPKLSLGESSALL